MRSIVAIVVMAGVLFSGAFVLLHSQPVRAEPVLEAFIAGVDFPVALAFAPDGRVFFGEISTGNIRIVENGVLLASPFYSLPDTATGVEGGLLGLAFHPQFPASPWLYAYQTFIDQSDGIMYNRVVRIRADGNAGLFHEVLLTGIPSAVFHNGGVIAFGPDGKLYVPTGDGQNESSAQDLRSLGGKILRMNPDGSVPFDNPFVGSVGANEYVYTYGHRNPFGLAFHPITGKAFSTENGPICNDEVNILVPGRNFGWGPAATCDSPPPAPENTNQDGPDPVLPIAWYTPTTAPVNAAIYAGARFPAWQGDLIFGEFNTANLRRIDLEPPNYDTVVNEEVVLTAPESILDVESGPDGAIWFTTPSAIYRFFDLPQLPTASFIATPSRVNPGVVVSFDASASVDPDGTIVSYSWDFGDGAVGAGVATTHAYVASGTYQVTLTVVDDESNRDAATGFVAVNAAPIIVSIFPTVDIILEGNQSQIFSVVASDADGDNLTYSWKINGAAAGSDGPSLELRTTSEGTYLITVAVSDGTLSDSYEWTVTVVDRGAAPPTFGWWIPLAAVLAAGASLGVGLWLRRRRQ